MSVRRTFCVKGGPCVFGISGEPCLRCGERQAPSLAPVVALPGGAERVKSMDDETLLRATLEQELIEGQGRAATPEERAFAVRELMAEQAGAVYGYAYAVARVIPIAPNVHAEQAVRDWLALTSQMQNFVETGRFEEPTVPSDGEDE